MRLGAAILTVNSEADNPMCYSAQIWADFTKYARFGGKLKHQGVCQTGRLDVETINAARAADTEAIVLMASESGVQEARLLEASAKLASPKPTKKVENNRRVATDKIDAGRRSSRTWPHPRPWTASTASGLAISHRC